VALAAINDEKTLAELEQQFNAHPNQTTNWKAWLQEGSAGDLTVLHAKIGESTPEKDFLSGGQQGRSVERKTLINREHEPPLTRQATLLKLSRGGLY
jgi:hypothetical protein